MPTFPRDTRAKPRLATPPRFPVGLQSWGQSGKGQFRSVSNMGRVWQEVYPILDTAVPAVRKLLEVINRSLRERLVWDVKHPYWQIRHGAGGGTPLVNGANQSGSLLVIDGASINITNWLRAGDLIQVAGAAVVFDGTADVNTNASGQASIPISPPIFQGQSPPDNGVVTIDPAAILFRAVIAEVSEYPDMDLTRYIDAGLTVTWREQPQ